jgi:phospholipid transport system transporter-binding protein
VSGDARPGEFVAADGGARWTYAGALTFANAEAVLESAGALPLPSSGVADLAGLEHADSAALAVLLALRRRAAAEGRTLAFASVPDSVVSLARVYGIDTIVGV